MDTSTETKEFAMMHPTFLYSQLQHRQQGLLGLGDGVRRDVRRDALPRRHWWHRSRPSQPASRPPAGRLVACGPAVAE
ncbi:hypothetical protein KZZ52_10620 [Dactylosporangium sp. AC04546]|uniref:hypothetical protein n=1 Tax=Dactylosporangium sp. AC04546 TaxID=2862460 RepID=UPI001EDD2ABE|nr:hypothetical protein [Dactylosporangium sp. AC04546]WVK85810.1 hypothetical protein KZZ52_10620 [Dactylosporangium sp. AC04546]